MKNYGAFTGCIKIRSEKRNKIPNQAKRRGTCRIRNTRVLYFSCIFFTLLSLTQLAEGSKNVQDSSTVQGFKNFASGSGGLGSNPHLKQLVGHVTYTFNYFSLFQLGGLWRPGWPDPPAAMSASWSLTGRFRQTAGANTQSQFTIFCVHWCESVQDWSGFRS